MNKSKMVQGRLIEFMTKDRIILNGFLMGKRSSRKCMIYVHGMTGNFYGGRLQFSLAKKIGRLGFSLFTFNTRGHDAVSVVRRVKGREMERLISGTQLEKFEDSVLDIDAAIRELKRLGFREFVLAGHSTGCQKIAYYQYKKRDRSVKGLVLLAPADDYAMQRNVLGARFKSVVRAARQLVKKGKGNDPHGAIPSHFSPRRFLSISDLRNVEARLFDYDGELREFSSIKVPVCAVFGSKEEYAYKPVLDYLRILKDKTGSDFFLGAVVDKANHSFRNRQDVTSEIVLKWLSSRRKDVQTRKIVEVNSRFPLAGFG